MNLIPVRCRFVKLARPLLLTLCLVMHWVVQAGCWRSEVAHNDKQATVSRDLLRIQQSYEAHIQSGSLEAYKPPMKIVRVQDGRVVIDAVAIDDAQALLAELEELGLQKGAAYGRQVSGMLPVEAINELQNLKNLKSVRPAYAKTNVNN